MRMLTWVNTDVFIQKEMKKNMQFSSKTVAHCSRKLLHPRRVLSVPEFSGNKSWLNNKSKRMLGSKTVGGLPKDPKMASGQRAPIVVGRGDPLLERQFKVIKLDSRVAKELARSNTTPANQWRY